MNIKIDLVISASPELLTFLQLLTSGKSVVQTTVWKDPSLTENGETAKAEVVEMKKTKTKKTETATPVEEAKIERLSEDDQIKTQATETLLSQEMIIADAVPKSKAGHKDKIKAKVTELGYESITDLQPVHFDEFWSFLQTIPKPA